MNPCRCGYLTDPAQSCGRAPKCAQEYQAKLSGPLLDRIDIHVEVASVSAADLDAAAAGGRLARRSPRAWRKARDIQRARFEKARLAHQCRSRRRTARQRRQARRRGAEAADRRGRAHAPDRARLSPRAPRRAHHRRSRRRARRSTARTSPKPSPTAASTTRGEMGMSTSESRAGARNLAMCPPSSRSTIRASRSASRRSKHGLVSDSDITPSLESRFPIVVVEDAHGVVAFASTSLYRSRDCYAGIAEFSVYVERVRTDGAASAASRSNR